MRKPVPMLDRQLSGDEFLKLIVDSFQSVVFGTVDQNGDPHTNVADIEVLDGNRLIFATTYQKRGCQYARFLFLWNTDHL